MGSKTHFYLVERDGRFQAWATQRMAESARGACSAGDGRVLRIAIRKLPIRVLLARVYNQDMGELGGFVESSTEIHPPKKPARRSDIIAKVDTTPSVTD